MPDFISNETVILLVGYNRPDYISNRLNELSELKDRNIFVSIDWCDISVSQEIEDRIKKFKIDNNSGLRIEYRIHKSNLGLARHITETITELLKKYENIIILEDDIQVNQNSIIALEFGINQMQGNSNIASVAGYSPMKIPTAFQSLNFFRKTKYFACWGWATNRDIWNKYELDLQGENIEKSLENSTTWSSLNKHQKRVWLRRFSTVQSGNPHTWDFQFQFMCFRYSLENLAPVGRISENLGFMDKRSQHTKLTRPWWLPVSPPPKLPIIKVKNYRLLKKSIEYLESISTIGDNRKRFNSN